MLSVMGSENTVKVKKYLKCMLASVREFQLLFKRHNALHNRNKTEQFVR